MKISDKQIPFTYQESKRVFENNLSAREAAENINKNCGIKITSSTDYYSYFKYLMTGQGSCRMLSKFTQEYYLEQIKMDYSPEQFNKSLKAFFLLIKKFEGEKIGSKKSMRMIYKKYSKLIG